MFINTNNNIYCNIYLQSADNIALYNYKNKLENIFKRENYIYNISFLPTKTKRYKILRSPHVYKKSIETYEEKIYSINFKLTISNLKNYKKFYNRCVEIVKNFCTQRNIKYHIKDGTFTEIK